MPENLRVRARTRNGSDSQPGHTSILTSALRRGFHDGLDDGLDDSIEVLSMIPISPPPIVTVIWTSESKVEQKSTLGLYSANIVIWRLFGFEDRLSLAIKVSSP